MGQSKKTKKSVATIKETALTGADLIRDEPLDRIAGSKTIPDSLDLLNHRSTARRVAQLAATAKGQMNVAVFGPWGSGKSSFFGLLEQELASLKKPLIPLRFDAWQNSGPGFRENFLADLSSQLNVSAMDQRLFSVKRSVQLPFASALAGKKRLAVLIGLSALALAIIVGLPVLHTGLTGQATDFWERFWPNWIGWVSFGASSSLIFVVVTSVANLARVDIEEARPSYVSQFKKLFKELLDSKPKRRFAILIDELDRCAPPDVMVTLEGLRTFLGDERCVFIVAFDRAAVAEAIRDYSANKVPLRQGAAYYATAGEYLDKIFQFQVSLPPQPHHGPRRYALSLVDGMGGVWESLRDRSPELVRKVVGLLSPIHLRSPRRTKVLLNDFAINARLYESMGFNWLERAEEIAAWTVIQTEFPGFAFEVEQDTRKLASIVRQIQADATAATPTDLEVDTDVIVGGDGKGAKEADEVSDELRKELRTYIRRLMESEVVMPRADLILMHAGGDLLRFEDPAVYNLLQDVAGASRGEATEILAAAEETDRLQALTYLFEQLETDLPRDERDAILLVAGDLAGALDRTELPPFVDQLRGTWSAVPTDRATVSASESAAFGFVRAFVDKPAALEDALTSITDSEVSAEVALRIADDSTDDELLAVSDLLASRAAWLGLAEPDRVSSLLVRIDAVGDPDLRATAAAIQEAFTIVEPTADATTRTRRGESVDAEEVAAAQYEADSSDAVMAFRELASPGYREDGSVRRSLNGVLLTIDGREDWPVDLFDELLFEERGPSAAQLNVDLLMAVSKIPDLASQWTEHLDLTVSVPALELQDALVALIRHVVTSEDEAEQTDSVEALSHIFELSVDDTAIELDPLVEAATPLTGITTWPSSRIESTFKLLALLESVDGDKERLYHLEERAVMVAYAAVDTSGAARLTAAITDLPKQVRRGLAAHLEPTSGDLATSLVARAQADSGFSPDELLPASLVVARYPQDPDILAEWLRAGPTADEVEALYSDSPAIFTEEIVRPWSRVASIDERAKLWRVFLEAGKEDLALAAAGADLPDGVADPELAEFGAASAASAREQALEALHALPSGSRIFQRLIVTVAPKLAEAGTQQDLGTLASLLERGPNVSAAERARIRSLMEALVARHPTVLSRQRIAALSDLGFMNRRGIAGFVDKVTGSGR